MQNLQLRFYLQIKCQSKNVVISDNFQKISCLFFGINFHIVEFPKCL